MVAGIHAIVESNRSPYPSPLPKGEGIQVAIMAPTEILARQHFEDMQDLLIKYNISSHLLV
ncbi:hypothetical protein HOG21_03710 [bacterium]|nr:hypothetical protein [bacterium]